VTTMKKSFAWTTRSLLLRLALALAIVLCFALLSRAGGPEYVAGTTYFTSAVPGQPLVWPQGQILYYTDQGDLSPLLPNAAATIFVANAFSVWTSVPTAAISVTNSGQLAEDVNGSNVLRNPDGSLTLPADIQPSATGTPIGIVYDYDGTVTDALLGSGAGASSQCFEDAAFGGIDNFGASADFLHALVILNGQCAQQSSQLPDVEYRLVRVLGEILGLGWSQVNLNVITGNPPPTSADYAGFPVMHYKDATSCVPITLCYPNPYRLAMDDAASISRLYPVTPQNQSTFIGKQIFASTTAGIHGTVWFTNAAGQPTQPMQGVNVVARWIDPSTGQPSRQYAASSVSGAFFTGNTGNPITGFYDPLGNLFSNWGSSTASMEGFFDISGLQIPNGQTTAQYELTVESLDPLWSMGVQPYGPFQVALSGQSALTAVNVTFGADVEQDILMAGSAQPVAPWAASQTWTVPAALPAAADWMESLNGYGNDSYFSFSAQANRTLSVAVTALDESGNPSAVKAQPVIGMWAASDPEGTAPGAFTPSALNTPMLGLTRLDAQILSPTQFLVGIADMRGDGRPDYHYHAHVLYGDSVVPSRIGASGGAITVQGMGFAPGQIVSIGSANVAPLAINAGQIILEAPPQPDGTQNITITDPVTGSSSVMTGVLTLGASATDNIVLLRGLNPPTPVGTQAVNPVTVQVVAADGITPVAGATIAWSSTNSAALSACGGAFSCSVSTDEVGSASTFVVPDAAGVATIAAALAPLSYSSSKSVSATVLGTLAASQIGVATPYLYIAQGASLTIPLTARVLSNGVPQSAATVNFNMTTGSGSLSATSATTSSSGYATVNLTLSQFAATVQVNACVAPSNAPCTPTYANPVPLAQQNLQPVAGENQIVALGQAFQPIIVRVTDSSSPPNPVLGASVAFENIVERSEGNSADGDSGQGNPVMPDILSVNQSSALTDFNGLASVEPSSGSFNGTLEVDVLATAGISALLNYVLEALPEVTETGGSNTNGSSIPPSRGNPVRPPAGWLEK
jgi:hypothetical protein